VAAAQNYAPVRILNHPAPLIIISVLVSSLAIVRAGRWKPGAAWQAAKLTYNQTLATTLGVSLMVMMAVLMADTGMTVLLAQGIANASGPVFPLVSPFIGLLGAFMSGSNTNSNVMFGLLQVETARALEIGPVTIASIQSIGASVGSTMAPTKVLVAAAVVGLAGQEDQIFRKVTIAVLALVALTGIEAMILVTLFENWTR
jgi:lactate permease